jgi:hypothetical protein
MAYLTGVEIPRTSIAEPGSGPNKVTVEFLRWTAFGQSAYQKNQRAGFSEEHAAQLVKRGAARIVGRVD